MIDERLKQYMYRHIDPTVWYPLENSRIMFHGAEVTRLKFPRYKDVIYITINETTREYPIADQSHLVVWKLQLALVLADRDLAISLAEEVVV